MSWPAGTGPGLYKQIVVSAHLIPTVCTVHSFHTVNTNNYVHNVRTVDTVPPVHTVHTVNTIHTVHTIHYTGIFISFKEGEHSQKRQQII